MNARTQPAPVHFEEIALYVLLVVIGAIPVVGVLVHREAFGAEASIGLGLLVLGLLGLVLAAATRLGYRRARATR